jgi:hypothetical protein
MVYKRLFTWVEPVWCLREDPFHQNRVPCEQDWLGAPAGVLVREGRLCLVRLDRNGQGAVRGLTGIPPEFVSGEGEGLEDQL